MMADLTDCKHEDFAAFVTVSRFEDAGRFMADVKIHCALCEEPFRFIGVPMGLMWDRPAASAFGLELRAPIEPQGEHQLAPSPRPGQLAEFQVPPEAF